MTRDAEKRRRAAELAARADELTRRALEVTAAVYGLDQDRRPEPIGSAVLATLGEARFLLTAGHVLDLMAKRPCAAPAGDQLLPVRGAGLRLFVEGVTSPESDFVDIGAIRLEGADWANAAPAAFASWPELDVAEAAPARNAFGLVGYPSTKQRHAVRGTTLTGRAYQFAGLEAHEAVYRAERVDPAVNLIVGFNKHRTLGPDGLVTSPDLYGVSGSGLWRFGRSLRHAKAPARLSGIVIEWRRSGRNKYVMATRVRPIVLRLATRYADVGDFVGARL